MATAGGYGQNTPGFTTLRESSEANIFFQTFFLGDVVKDPAGNIESGAVDSGNTPTTILRPGLIMGRLDSTGEWTDYDPDANDGSQEAAGILCQEVNMLDPTTNAVAARQSLGIVTLGKVKTAMLVNSDMQARNQLAARGFTFDDKVSGPVNEIRRVITKAADYTIVAADHRTRFVAITGAVIFTLPAIAVGLKFWFLNAVDANMTVASAEGDNVITDHDLSADSIAFSTASHKIGSQLAMEAIYVNGTLKWIPTFLNAVSTNTATVAT